MVTSTPKKNSSPMFLGGQARNFAAWMALIGALVSFGFSFWISWPLGPAFVDEAGVTQIRLAVAMLVLGQALALSFLIYYLRDILMRVKRLTDDGSKSPAEK